MLCYLTAIQLGLTGHTPRHHCCHHHGMHRRPAMLKSADGEDRKLALGQFPSLQSNRILIPSKELPIQQQLSSS